MATYEPRKSIHDFHLARASSPYTRYKRDDKRMPLKRWPNKATSVIVANVDTSDAWRSSDDTWYTPINDTPVRCIIRQGERGEIVAIFPDEKVTDYTNKRGVEVWSSKYGYRLDTASSAYHRTEDYEGTDFDEWADIVAKTVGRVITTRKNL